VICPTLRDDQSALSSGANATRRNMLASHGGRGNLSVRSFGQELLITVRDQNWETT
jgi:hypothetical protein